MARPIRSDVENDLVRDQLAKSALALFREFGHEGVSLRKLAKYVGVSHTLLYRYFDNKEALFTTIRLASLNVLNDMLAEADDKTASPLERIRSAGKALVSYGRTYPNEYRFIFSSNQAVVENNSELIDLRHIVFNHIVDVAKEAKKENLISIEPRTWVHITWATIHGILTLNENNQLLEGRSFDDLVDSALELLLGEHNVRAPLNNIAST